MFRHFKNFFKDTLCELRNSTTNQSKIYEIHLLALFDKPIACNLFPKLSSSPIKEPISLLM